MSSVASETTTAELATAEFERRARLIPGVMEVEIGIETIRVVVPDQFGEAGRSVRDLEFDIAELYPGACLDVWLSECPSPAVRQSDEK